MKTLKLYYRNENDYLKFNDKSGNEYVFALVSTESDNKQFISLLGYMCETAKNIGLKYITVKVNDVYDWQYNKNGKRIIEVKSSITGKYSLKTPRFMEFV